MSRSDEDGRQEEDPFWEIALNYDGRGKIANEYDNYDYKNQDVDDDDSNGANGQEEDRVISGKTTIYHLPNSSVSLELAALASEDGVWSPVGDHAWYSSALLTCLILQGTLMMNEEDDDEDYIGESKNKRKGDISGIRWDQYRADKEIRVLELGSGAIGLSGISFAVALSQRQKRFPLWTVSLTDNDMSLLKQLKANVRFNICSNNIMFSSTDDGTESLEKRSIEVEYLDWDLEYDSGNDDDEIQIKSNEQDRLLSADIVIGSELVYTKETGVALVKVLLTLLDRNPAVKIWIVQVTDRYGWKEIVIPALESENNINIQNIPLTYDIHEIASTMIPMGGALDRYAFGAFCISNYTSPR